MSLLEIASRPSHNSVTLAVEFKAKILEEIKEKLKSDVEPRIWRLYLGDDPNGEFPETCMNIVSDVVGKHDQIPDDSKQWHAETLFDEVQSYFYEISEEVRGNLDFIDKLLRESEKEIEDIFPGCKNVLGESATQLLIDLACQYHVYLLKIHDSENLVDIRRMINIIGQIIEDIFFKNLMRKEWDCGSHYTVLQIYNHLRGLRGDDREKLKRSAPRGERYLDKYFLERLHRIGQFRNDYSHGRKEDMKDPKNDFQECITALLEEKYGILRVLYASLREHDHQ